MKIVQLRRMGNEGPFAEGNQGTLMEESWFTVNESTWNDLQTGDMVTSFWTSRRIVPDGSAPKHKDAAGQFAILTRVTESNVLSAKSSIADVQINFTAADYGWKDDFETGLPDPS